MVFKSNRPIYAIVMLVLSSLFICATFLPLLYSILFPNEDIQGFVSALEQRQAASPESESVVQQAIGAVGPLSKAIKIGYYSGTTKTFHLDGSGASETVKASQATYIAWFEQHPGPTLIAITCNKIGENHKTYQIREGDPASVVRAYAIPICLFGVSLFLVRRRMSPAAF